MNKGEIKQLLQHSVELLHEGKRWRMKMMSNAQKLGLQAEKRFNSIKVTEYENLIKFFIRNAYDYLGIELEFEPKNVHVYKLSSPDSYLESAIEKLEYFQDSLHELSNKFITVKCKYYSQFLDKEYYCLVEEITELRRLALEYKMAEGKPELLLLLRQTTGANKHDHLEVRERELGYTFK